MTRKLLASALTALLICGGSPAARAKVFLSAPDGSEVEIKEGTPQPDLSAYRSPLRGKIADRRFVPSEHFYLANEQFLSGTEFFVDAVSAGFPVANWPEFQWVTAFEGYWYSRYLIEWAASRSHAGVGMVHGPYWTLKARELYARNRLNRDRGERVPANKGVALSHYMPLYYQRTGFPRVFDDAAPAYLSFASADPHFIQPVPVADDFADPQSGKKGNWGMPRFYLDYFNTRWDRDKMDKSIDLGGTAQSALKMALWVQYFWHSDHQRPGPSGDEFDAVSLLGNDAEEGFRGIVLALASFNTLLEAKASLFADPRGALGGVDPFAYEPARGLRYLPHRIAPNLVLLGDLPERTWSFHAQDRSSRLWDQASWLWLASTYFHLTRSIGRAFTANPPVDGGVIERETGRVALGMARVLLKNIRAMHLRDGRLVSSWTPKGGPGDRLTVEDWSLTMVALKDAAERFAGDSEEERWVREEAGKLLAEQAELLLKAQGEDGSFAAAYAAPALSAAEAADHSAPQFWAIRGLLAAWQAGKDPRYAQAAFRAFDRLEGFWDEGSGLYRTRLGDDTVTLAPKELGAAVGALRELAFAAERGKVRPLLERYTRFWVQAFDGSGLQMAESYQTGEVDYGRGPADQDADGIPFAGRGHGRYGIAPVPARKVFADLSGGKNAAFDLLPGEASAGPGPGKSAYKPPGQAPLNLAEKAPGAVAQLQRTTGPAWYAEPGELPERPSSGLSGAELFRLNCAACHGAQGQGITGKPLAPIVREGGARPVVVDGRPPQRMPSWGKVLTAEEIGAVIEHLGTLPR